eukprot:3939704-Rhodomonas_salina.1
MGVSPRPHSSRVQSLRCGCHTIERDTSESPYSSRRFFVEFGSQSAKWSSCEIRKPWCGSRCFWYSSRPAAGRGGEGEQGREERRETIG